MKKTENNRKNEMKKEKEENTQLNLEIGKLQYNKDKLEAEVKAEEKLKKIRENTLLFNKIIENKLLMVSLLILILLCIRKMRWKNVTVVKVVQN